LAGVLGAVVLALVLLYRANQRNRARISELTAELAAQKIAALTMGGGLTSLPRDDDEDPDLEAEPVRRKRHLALYMGGGVVAFVTTFGDRVRAAVRGRRVTATLTAATLAVAGSAALMVTSGNGANGSAEERPQAAPTAPAKKHDDHEDEDEPGGPVDDGLESDEEGPAERLNVNGASPLPFQAVSLEEGEAPAVSPASSSSSAPGSPGAPSGPGSTTGPDSTPAPGRTTGPGSPPAPGRIPGPSTGPTPPGTTAPGTTAPPTTGPAPKPSPTPTPSPPKEDDGLVCVDLPKVLDLCLLGAG
jgi:hypothetical protein